MLRTSVGAVFACAAVVACAAIVAVYAVVAPSRPPSQPATFVDRALGAPNADASLVRRTASGLDPGGRPRRSQRTVGLRDDQARLAQP